MPKIKLWTKTHPGEQLAERFASSLGANPIANIDIGIVNELGAELGKRVVNINMMQAYPGDETAKTYEQRRAAEVLKESRAYDIVLDLHSIRQHGDATGVVSARRGVTPMVLGFLSSLSIKNLVLDTTGIYDHLDNAFCLEVSAALYNNADGLHHGLEVLANDPNPPQSFASDFKWFTFIGDLHQDHFDPRTNTGHVDQMEAYKPLPPAIDRQIKLHQPFLADQTLCAMAWSAEPNQEGYWGEINARTPVTGLYNT